MGIFSFLTNRDDSVNKSKATKINSGQVSDLSVCNILILTDKTETNVVKLVTSLIEPEENLQEILVENGCIDYKLYAYESNFDGDKNLSKLRNSLNEYKIKGEEDLYKIQPNNVHALIRGFQDNLYSTTASYLISDIITTELASELIARLNENIEDIEDFLKHLSNWGMEQDVRIDNLEMDASTYQVTITMAANQDTLRRLTSATSEYDYKGKTYTISRPLSEEQYQTLLNQ